MIIVYEENGRISQIVTDPIHEEVSRHYTEENIPHISRSLDIAAHEVCARYFVDIPTKELVERPVFDLEQSYTIAADGEDTLILEGLPEDIRVLVDGEELVVEDGLIEIASDMPATYNFYIEHWPYMSAQFIVEAA